MDKETSAGTGLAYDKVLVEVTATSPLPDSILVRCQETIFEQAIKYYWKPKACPHCKTLSHNLASCLQSFEKEAAKEATNPQKWVRKQEKRGQGSSQVPTPNAIFAAMQKHIPQS